VGQWGGWVKKGFVFQTEPGQNSVTISIKNNAPGGGGNDWVMDDISLASCLPELEFFPTISNEICQNAQVRASSIVSTFFSNYRYYQWERSTDGGTNWHAAPLKPAIDSFDYNFNNNVYRDTVYYPDFLATTAIDGHLYRLRVSTSIDNLADDNCNNYSASTIVNINIGTCDILPASILSFNGAIVDNNVQLKWETQNERQNGWFEIERSTDGVNFTKVGTVLSKNGTSSVLQFYRFTDLHQVVGKTYYRLKIVAEGNTAFVYSNTIILYRSEGKFELSKVVSPFQDQLRFDIRSPRSEKITIRLSDIFGRVVSEKKLTIETGITSTYLNDVSSLPGGTYLLLITSPAASEQRIVLKK
jgi:hypothetical protein